MNGWVGPNVSLAWLNVYGCIDEDKKVCIAGEIVNRIKLDDRV